MYATIGGIGYVKRGPATVGAIVGALIFFFIQPMQTSLEIVLLLAVFLFGVLASSVLSKKDNLKDPQYIIMPSFLVAVGALFSYL